MVKRFASVIAAAALFTSLIPAAAYAEGTILDALKNSAVVSCGDNAWEDYVDFLIEYEDISPDNIALGYYNAETGEEYYHNGDEYFIAASMYKVPLNMIYAERVSDGGMTMDTKVGGIPYSELQRSTIVDSSNDKAEIMWNALGGYGFYKQQSAKFLTADPDSLPYKYYENNWFTAEQFIYCLKLLIESPDRYPGVIDCMLQASPGVHFKRDTSWCPVASKMGYVEEPPYHSVYNDMAIVYTTDTFAIVMFTDNLDYPCDALADYCTLMCDFTNTRHYDRESRQNIKDSINNTFSSVLSNRMREVAE